jgi:hypothetical protein
LDHFKRLLSNFQQLSKKSNPDKNSPQIFNPIISQNYKNILFLEFSWKNNQLATSRILAILEFSPPFSKSIKIVERIDSLLPKTSNNQNITHGEVATSLYTTGNKYKNTGNIELKRGYSKDYRMDLKQLIYLLVTTEDGLPILAESHS